MSVTILFHLSIDSSTEYCIVRKIRVFTVKQKDFRCQPVAVGRVRSVSHFFGAAVDFA